MSWEPLASSDPIPGDPDAVAALAERLRAVAGTIAEQNDRLRSIEAGTIWTGDAAAAFTDVQDDLPPLLDIVHARYSTVGTALAGYVEPLRNARSEARVALQLAREAEADIHSAERGIEAMEDHARNERARAETSTPDEEPYEPRVWSGPDWYGRKSAAEAALQAARDRLDRAIEARATAGRAAADTIKQANNDDIKDDRSAFGRFKRTVSNAARALVDALPIEELATIAAVAAGVIAVASLLIPGVNLVTAGLLLGAGALLLDGVLWAADDFEADTGLLVALDVVGLATFGVGRVFGSAARGTGMAGRAATRGTQLAARADQATSAAARWGRVTSFMTQNPLGRLLGGTWPGRAVSGFAQWRAGVNTTRSAELAARSAEAFRRADTFTRFGLGFEFSSSGSSIVSGGIAVLSELGLHDTMETPPPTEIEPIAPPTTMPTVPAR